MQRKITKILLWGNNKRTEMCLNALLKSSFQVTGLVVLENAYLNNPNIIETAKKNNIEIILVNKMNSIEFVQKLESKMPDLMVLAGFNKILKSIHLKIPKFGVINLHGGRLPEYRGASTIHWQIINGEKQGGCCVLYADEGIDTGAILKQELYDIHEEDTAQTVTDKTLNIFPRILLDALNGLNDNLIKPIIQNLNEGKYHPKRTAVDSEIFWEKNTDVTLYNFVRALDCNGVPNAFSYIDGNKVNIKKVKIIKDNFKGIAGNIGPIYEDGIIIFTNNRGLLLRRATDEYNQEIDLKKLSGKRFTKMG